MKGNKAVEISRHCTLEEEFIFMPSGRTHAAITILAAGSSLAAGNLAGLPAQTLFALSAGCLAGLLITPDLDVDEPVRSHSIVRRQAGFIPSIAWRLLWLPYAKSIPHRHWLSHAPVLGTLIRAAYLSAILWIVLALLGQPFPWETPPIWMRWSLIGLMISDCLHWAADLWFTSVKRTMRRIFRLVLG